MIEDTLQYYGNTFQQKVIASLMTDRLFLQQSHDLIDAKYFGTDAMQWIVKQTLDYFKEYKSAPTLEVLKVKLDSVDIDLLKTSIIDGLKECLKHHDASDLPFVKDKTIDFCKNQKLKNAILNSVDLLKNGQYDQIKNLIDLAMKAGSDRNVGHDYLEDIAERFKENLRSTIQTPWDVLNDVMDGGLGKGELGVFVAPAGIGKSMALVNVAADAVKKGLNVVYYTCELSETYVGARFDSHYTGIPSQDLKFHQDEIADKLKGIKGRLVVKYYPTKTATVSMINAHLEKCIMQGFKPDLVIIDYADLLRDSGGKNSNVRHDIMLGNIYEDIRGLAGIYQIPIYTASQANRSSLEDDIIEADKISESYAKIMVADFVVSLSRKINDKISGTGRWHIIKNRFGPDGITFPSKMNMSICQIQIFGENTIDGQDAKKNMMSGDEYLRKTLASKFSELTGKI